MKRIADPIHGTITLTDVEVALIQSSTFQRLRGIKQLGLANLVFPGADYSRFVHSVGVCHVAGRLVTALRSHGCTLTDTDERMYRAAALLHDVGHYPFSHAMERAVENYYRGELTEPDQGHADTGLVAAPSSLNHEAVGQQILSSEKGEVGQILRAHDIDPNKIVAIIGHHVDAPALANLISSDLDADRIDYLMRTAHATGLPYGHIDLDYLLAMVRLDCDEHICLDRKAMRTAEHLLLARYFDYQQVSFHHTVAAYETLLEDILSALLRAELLDCSATAVRAGIDTPSSWVQFDDAKVTGLIREFAASGPGGPDQDKARALLTRNGPKLIWSTEFFADKKTSSNLLSLRRTIVDNGRGEIADALGVPSDFVWTWSKRSSLSAIGSQLPASKALEPDDEERHALGESVLIAEPEGPGVRLEECEDSLFHALADQALTSLRVYVLYPPTATIDRGKARAVVEGLFH